MIIETTSNQKYRVWETNQDGLDHVWFGNAVKRAKGEWVNKNKVRVELVSKAHLHRVVEV